MSQSYDDATRTAGATGTLSVRTHAALGLSLALVGLLGGGIIANAIFFVLLDPMGYGGSTVLQGLPSLVMGIAGAGLGWSGSTSADDVAAPVGRTAVVVGVLAVIGAIALMVAGRV